MEDAKDDMADNTIDIIYENNDVMVVNKPAGLAVHKDGKTDEYTLADWILETYPEIKGIGEPLYIQGTRYKQDTNKIQDTGNKIQEIIDRPGIVHRLDRDTSGVLVIAKNQPAFDYLKKQFQEHHIRKTYVAIVYGVVKKDSGTIDRPIGRSPKDFRRWSAQPGARGTMREATTHFEAVKRGKEHTLLHVYPKTGRTHQIRVHLKAINHPVVCDSLYAPKRPCPFGLTRQALHATTLSFNLPNGERITVEAPLPEDMKYAVAQIR